MKILHIIKHDCPRVHKLATAESNLGHEVSLVTGLPVLSHEAEAKHTELFRRPYTNVFHFRGFNTPRFINQLRDIGQAFDVIVVHNEPDAPMLMARLALPGKKIIWSAHDLNSMRNDENKTPEDSLVEYWAGQEADGILVPSEPMIDYLKQKHPLTPMEKHPSAVPLSWYPKIKPALNPGIMMPTGLSIQPGHYRYWADIFNILTKAKIPVRVQCGSFQALMYYRRKCPKVSVQGPIPINQMLNDLSTYQCGLAGMANYDLLSDVQNPNKFFEYLAAGIPVIGYKSQNIKHLIERYKCGIFCENPNELIKAFETIDQYRPVVQRQRQIFSMEQYVPRIHKLYHKAGTKLNIVLD